MVDVEVSSHQAKGQMEDGRSIFSRHTQEENGDQKGVQCPQHNVVNDHLGRGVLFYISIAYQTLPTKAAENLMAVVVIF